MVLHGVEVQSEWLYYHFVHELLKLYFRGCLLRGAVIVFIVVIVVVVVIAIDTDIDIDIVINGGGSGGRFIFKFLHGVRKTLPSSP
jgi:hypothetical protein